MAGNENGKIGQRRLKFSCNVLALDDEEEDEGHGKTDLAEGHNDVDVWTPMERDDFHDNDTIKVIKRDKRASEIYNEKDFIGVARDISHTSKKKLLKYVNKIPTAGTHGCIRSNDCRPVEGKYDEGKQFKVLNTYAASGSRSVSHCMDLTTNAKFIRKQIPKTEWNKNEVIIPLQLEHDNLGAVLGVLQRDQNSSLRVELLLKDAGISLEEYLKRARLPLPEEIFWDIIAQGLRALNHIDKHHIVHHDVKPSNFVIDDGGRVRLIDFGSARLPYETVNSIGGWTLEYLAPECCKYLLAMKAKRSVPDPIHPITTKVDVFAFAMVIYFLMTGKHLLVGLVTPDCEYAPGQRGRLRNRLVQQISENPEGIRELISRNITDEGIRDLIFMMSHENVESRYSAEEALDKVHELRHIETPKNSRKRSKFMIEEEVYSIQKVKTRGPTLQHPCIRTQESVHHGESSGQANTSETSQRRQFNEQAASKPIEVRPWLDHHHLRPTAHLSLVEELRDYNPLPSDGTAAVAHKTAKLEVTANGEDASMTVALHPQFIPVHAAAEVEVGQPRIDHNKLLQQLKKKVLRRTAAKMGPSPPVNDISAALPSDLGCIPTDELICMEGNSRATQAAAMGDTADGGLEAGNNGNKETNKELPFLNVLLSTDSI